MYQEPTRPAKSLAMIQAEQRNLSQLKNYGLPWVFIQPTRLKKVKVPKEKHKNKNQETFEKLGADDLAFLGNANIDLSEEDIKTLLHSVQNDSVDFNSPQISKNVTPRKLTLITPDIEPKVPSPANSNRYSKKQISLSDNDECEEDDLFSARGPGDDNLPDIFGDDPDLEVRNSPVHQKSARDNDSQTVKKLIMENLTNKRKEISEKPNEAKIKPYIGANMIDDNQLQMEPEKNEDDDDFYDISSGRKKLLSLMGNISSVGKEPSVLKQAEMRLKPQFDETKEKLQYSVGAARFRQFCEEQYGKAPDVLANLDMSKAKMRAKTTLARPKAPR